MLEMRSTTQGLLVPRMTQAQKTAIVAPATGLLVYQTDGSDGFYYYDGAAWQPFGGGGGADDLGNHTATQELIMSGFPIVHTAGHEGISVLASGFVGIGDVAPAEKLEVTGGNIRVGSSAGTSYGIQLQNPAGTFTTTHKAGAQTADITYTWPTTAPSNGQLLQSDGSGNLSWSPGNDWSLTGNSGTNPALNYLGTFDAQPLRFATTGSERMRINAGAAEVGIGMTPTATYTLDITNATNTGRGLNITANSLTTGSGIVLTANGLTSGTGLNVSSSSVGHTGSLVHFNSTGSTSGNVLDVTGSAITSGRAINVTSNAITTGSGIVVTANALTSGTGLNIASSSAGLTGNLVNLDASGSTAGTVLNAQGNMLTTGKVANLTANSLTTGTALNVSSSSASHTGVLADLLTTGSTDGTVIRVRGNATTIGTVANISGNSLTSGTVLNVASGSASLTGILANFDANSSTSGTVIRGRGNALTVGSALSISSTSTAFTGNTPAATNSTSTALADISLSGSNAANTGNVLRVANTGSANTGSTLVAYNLAATPARPVVDIKSNQTSGTMLGLGAQAATALAGTLTAINADLSTNFTNTEQSLTGLNISLPATTAASGSAITALKVSSGAVTNASGATDWKGLDITMPAMTESGGTLTSTGIRVTGVVAGTGTEKGIIVEDADVLISNTNGESGQLQIQGNCTGITSFEAGAQGGADIRYILPARQATSVNQALLNNGNGVLSWGSPPPVSSQAASVSGSNITGFHSTTYTSVASMSVTPGEGNFLVWFSTSVYNVNRTDNIIKIAIFVNGVMHAPSEREFKSPSDHSTGLGTNAYLTNVLAGDVVEVRWKVTDATGDAEMYNRSMQLMKVQ
jgi:hypothetical protein